MIEVIRLYRITCNKKYPKELNIKSFFERFNELSHSDKKNIIYVKDEFEVTTFRYRAYNVTESLNKSDKYFAVCFLVDELRNLSKVIDKIDLIVLQRCKWLIELESFVNYA